MARKSPRRKEPEKPRSIQDAARILGEFIGESAVISERGKNRIAERTEKILEDTAGLISETSSRIAESADTMPKVIKAFKQGVNAGMKKGKK